MKKKVVTFSIFLFFVLSHYSFSAPSDKPPECKWTNPQTNKTESLILEKIPYGDKTIYESCSRVQSARRAQYLREKYADDEDKLREQIERKNQIIRDYNEQQERLATSANEKADQASTTQQLGGMVAIGGSMAATSKAMACCGRPESAACCAAWLAIAAGLGVSGVSMLSSAKNNHDIANEYRGGMPEIPDGGGSIFPAGPGNGGISPFGSPPPFITTYPNNPGYPLTPKGLRDSLADSGLEWDPEKGEISLPDGTSYGGGNTAGLGALTSQQQKTFKNEMANLKDKIQKAMTTDNKFDENSIANANQKVKEGPAGGGGFSGYSSSARGLGRRGPSSSTEFDHLLAKKDKNHSKLANMFVKNRGDKIGIGQDNIFEMIHRRYQRKRKLKQFMQ